jgi:hypothetical protein
MSKTEESDGNEDEAQSDDEEEQGRIEDMAEPSALISDQDSPAQVWNQYECAHLHLGLCLSPKALFQAARLLFYRSNQKFKKVPQSQFKKVPQNQFKKVPQNQFKKVPQNHLKNHGFFLQHVPRDSSLPSDAMLDDTPVGGPRHSRSAK